MTLVASDRGSAWSGVVGSMQPRVSSTLYTRVMPQLERQLQINTREKHALDILSTDSPLPSSCHAWQYQRTHCSPLTSEVFFAVVRPPAQVPPLGNVAD